ncbi:MAG: hypothetical protein AAF226_08250 [Verrucomicrobiota bacterium]
MEPEVLKFFCPYCERKLSATADQFGKEMPCPFDDCRERILVPSQDWKPMPTEVLQKGAKSSSELLAEAEEMTRKKDAL